MPLILIEAPSSTYHSGMLVRGKTHEKRRRPQAILHEAGPVLWWHRPACPHHIVTVLGTQKRGKSTTSAPRDSLSLDKRGPHKGSARVLARAPRLPTSRARSCLQVPMGSARDLSRDSMERGYGTPTCLLKQLLERLNQSPQAVPPEQRRLLVTRPPSCPCPAARGVRADTSTSGRAAGGHGVGTRGRWQRLGG